MMHRKPLILSVAGILLCGTVACFRPVPNTTRYFVLKPTQEKSEAKNPSKLRGSILLGPVTLASYLDRQQLVIRQSTNQLYYSATDRWAEPLGVNIPRVLRQNLEGILPEVTIKEFGAYGGAEADYQILLDILQFDSDDQGNVVLDVRWKLIKQHGRNRKILVNRPGRFTGSAGDASVGNWVTAQSQTLAQLANALAESF